MQRRLDASASLSSLAARLSAARNETDRLFTLVKPEHLHDRPIAERHRLIFYIGHLEAFDWNLLGIRHLGLPAFAPQLDQLFAFGIDPIGSGLPADTPADWPALSIIHAYRDATRRTLDAYLKTPVPANSTHAIETTDTLLHTAIEHRLMHAETLAYLLHQLPYTHKQAPADMPPALPPARAHSFTAASATVTAGEAWLGMTRATGFGWDNELLDPAMTAHRVHVPAFTIDRYMVSNGEFADFIAAGGYRERAFWNDADWDWIRSAEIEHPAFWRRDDDTSHGWSWRRMFDEVPLPLDWPVYVSHAEAAAYARYAGKALPSEAQWQRARAGNRENSPKARPNADFRSWDPQPVDADDGIENHFGVRGLSGNGWEWTATPFAALPGFEPFPFYEGYSANFFDDQHYVLKGGSPRTAASMLRPSFRNWFQPHYPYAYAGFRCVDPA